MCLAWHEIRDHLTVSSTAFSFQRGFDAIRRSQAPLKPYRDPASLLDALHRKTGDVDAKNRILVALIEAAQADDPSADTALTLLLQALWPGLDAIRRRSIWRKLGTIDEITSDVLARTIDVLRSLDLGCVNWVAATVLRNVERDMIRARNREIGRAKLSSGIEPDEVSAHELGMQSLPEDAALPGHLHKLLGADALLVIRVAIEGYSQVEAGVELGLTEAAARKRYQRALRKLRDALADIP